MGERYLKLEKKWYPFKKCDWINSETDEVLSGFSWKIILIEHCNDVNVSYLYLI